MAPPTDSDAAFTSSDLVRTFAWRAGVAVLILAVVIGIAASIIVESVMRAEAVRLSSLAADALLRHELTGVPIDRPLPPEVAERLDQICARDLSANGITAVKVWSPAGMLVYSSDRADRVGVVVANAEVARASKGRTVTEIAADPDAEDAVQAENSGPLVEVYRPLPSGGVIEMYQSFSRIAAGIERTRGLTWLGVLALAIPAYMIELQIVRRAARKLDHQESALAETNERLTASLANLEAHTLGSLSALAATVDAKDSYTARHSLMVADYSRAIAQRMRLADEELHVLEQACLLHDLGKIATPESILLKPGKLDHDEIAVIQAHAARGAEIVASIPFLEPAAEAVRHHHERCDGRGYPDGLVGEEISILARIISVADTFDAMTSNRPYRPARTPSEARDELIAVAGTQLCPTVVTAFLEALDAGEIAVGERHIRQIAS